MKTKTLRLPVFFASAGALICAMAAHADSSWSQSTTQTTSSSEYPTASRFYPTIPGQGASYMGRGYFSGGGSLIDPDTSNDHLMHMYQRGKQAAETLNNQIRPNPIVVYKTAPDAYGRAAMVRTASSGSVSSSSSSGNWNTSSSGSSAFTESAGSGGARGGATYTTDTGASASPSVSEPSGAEKKEKKDENKQDNQNQDQSRNDLSGQSAAATDVQKSEPEKSASSSADVSKEAAGAQSSKDSSSSSSESKSSVDVNAPAGAAAAGSLPSKVQTAINDDASLSTAAQDVKFSMEGDKLEVQGTVKSQDEKDRIMEKVKANAGSTEIDDQLKVSSESKSPDDK